jgi:hypothetical protein
MKAVIWKQHLEGTRTPKIYEIPIGAEIMRFAIQDGKPTIWYLCDKDKTGERSKRCLCLVFTGQEISAPILDYIGMVVDEDQQVWHLLELDLKLK